jgi:diguanylate cyclase (GGDEF)-like protein
LNTADIFKHYPEYTFIEVENIQQGLDGVANGKFDAMLATMALACYHIAEMGLHNIRVVGKTPIIMDLTLFIAKTEPILHSIINKAFKDITSSQSHQILQHWIKREYVETIDYRLMIEIISGMLFIMIWIFIWNRRLKREINLRKVSEKELNYLESHDALTGLYNRMRFEQLIKQEIKRAERYNHSVSLFLIDIDHFKQINDTYGHRVGDRTLKSFSKLLLESIRSTDHAARYGGEEFIVLLPETNSRVAKELAERLKTKVNNHHFSTEEIENLKFTISIGVSSYPDGADTWEMLIHNSDSAMYTAKREGRNQVRVA